MAGALPGAVPVTWIGRKAVRISLWNQGPQSIGQVEDPVVPPAPRPRKPVASLLPALQSLWTESSCGHAQHLERSSLEPWGPEDREMPRSLMVG